SFTQITKCFDENPYWTRSDPKDKNSFGEDENVRSFYNEYQYFYPQARNALYGYDGNVVKTYSFAKKEVHEKAHYYITKWKRTYDLLINAIRLKIYNTGVALFIMECENHGKDKYGNGQASLADVKNINDFGRRITLPFVPEKPEYSVCADKLEIAIPELGVSFASDFRDFIIRVGESCDAKAIINLNHLCDFVKDVINYGGTYLFSSNDDKVRSRKQFKIRLALDDRMFVACIVNDKSKTEEFLKVNGGDIPLNERKYAYEENEKLSKSLYEFIFVDSDEGCTCQSSSMRSELLEKHIYKRWLDSGSIYAMSAQSLVLLFNGAFEPLIGSFLTIYERIVCLCIVQRASIMVFQKELALLSVQIHEKGNRMRTSTVTRLMDLQERFAAFESQICFTEVTSQEQGIDIYEMMTGFFFINDEMENIKSQLDILNEAANTYLDFGFNKIGIAFTFIGALYGALGMNGAEFDGFISWLGGLFGRTEASVQWLGSLLWMLMSVGFAAIIWLIIAT
ncbi:MAG: hypothetical protein J6C89_00080, partial [Clostridia bacterium]|nr:hypothetical protein [Clostridia bacterium]